uniref:protein FD-like n=1 Tax=Fragaria vesca subsp. vesca TaxID=101020 RepID=UPI0005CB48B0|nr:PREDICTED: protein FD-like [Fragaria vesca subsp. vesca]
MISSNSIAAVLNLSYLPSLLSFFHNQHPIHFSIFTAFSSSPNNTMEETWRQTYLASLSSSAQAPFANDVPHPHNYSSTAAHDPTTSSNFPHPMMQNYQLFCYNGPLIINPNQGFDNTSTSSSFGTRKNKRVYEYDHSNSKDPKFQRRLIKNRESAERSRARKQAYREELERKVEHLKQENARRKKELETSIAAASGQLSITHNHRRSSSALF